MRAGSTACRDYKADFFVLRTPLLPIGALKEWSAGLEAAAAADPERLSAALEADRSALRARLRRWLSDNTVREALYFGSPGLLERIHDGTSGPETRSGRKVERAAIRYFARMAGRATPFGLFAGQSVGSVGTTTRLDVSGRPDNRCHLRLDGGCLAVLTESIQQDPDVRESLTWYPNSSLARVGGRIRYCERRRSPELPFQTDHNTVSVRDGEPLNTVIRRARTGATIEELTRAVVDVEPEAALSEAEEFVSELIDSQVLISNLVLRVSGPEPFDGLLRDLRTLRSASRTVATLEQIQSELEHLPAEPPGSGPECYHAISQKLYSLCVTSEKGPLLHVDMLKAGENLSLGAEVIEELQRGVRILQRLRGPGEPEALVKFRRTFVDRYQHGNNSPGDARWIPLLDALDEEIGIVCGDENSQHASSLLDGLDFPGTPSVPVLPWGRRESVLFRKLAAALSRGEREIEVSETDLDELAAPEPAALPDAFSVTASIAADSAADLADGKFHVALDSASGPSGARLLGRFCHADPELREQVSRHLFAEESLHPDAIFAEIVHLPENERMVNVIARPRLREYEIVYLAGTDVPGEKQIPVDDLEVCVVGDEVLLRSRRLGRQVIPRLTTAHNFEDRGHGVYQFLGRLQQQHTPSLTWSWGSLHASPFLPRVTCGRLILSRARWLLHKAELTALADATGADRFARVQQWRREQGVPRWVVLQEDDNELPIDLDNVLLVETFVEAIRNQDMAVVVELCPEPDRIGAQGPEGRFVHEIIVPFVRNAAPHDSASEARRADILRLCGSSVADVPDVRRQFAPGSEWLTLKLYTGPALADEVLCEVIAPLTRDFVESGAVAQWFFIRYGDPDWHLRMRYHGDPAVLNGRVLPALQAAVQPYLDDGHIARMQLDTYEREMERYGGPRGIELCEAIFQADSEAVLDLSDLLVTDVRGDVRWRLALCGMDRLLRDLGLSLQDKAILLEQLRASYAEERGADRQLKRQISSRFRRERSDLESLLDPEGIGLPPAARAAFERRSRQIAAAVASLRRTAEDGTLKPSLPDLAGSLLHMHANRLLRSSHRAQELVLYEFLARVYASRAAREVSEPAVPADARQAGPVGAKCGTC